MDINKKELTEFVKCYFGKIGNKEFYTFEDVRDAIRAGAKWMAEQGETVEEEVLVYEPVDNPHNISKYIEIGEGILNVLGLQSGDKVIVQIRKKV